MHNGYPLLFLPRWSAKIGEVFYAFLYFINKEDMGIVNREGALYMATGIDNSGLKKDAAEAENIIDGIGAKSEKTGSRMQKSFQSMESAIASAKETMSVLERTISMLNSKLDSNAASSSADAKKVAELEAALADLKTKYDSLNKSVPQNGSEIKKSANEAKKATSDYESLSKSINNAWRALGIGISFAGLKALGKEIINVHGEMQMLESSFEVLLGGKGVSGFMAEMKQFAVDSPLSLTGVANAAQTLLGFGVAADSIMPTIKQIGDVSMGNEERFKSLSLAFAQMSATGKLMGQDLLQMINAGFNPLQIIAEKTGKSISALKDEMSNGAISSQMVANAFASATEKGGKFYGMTQKQAEGIRGLQAQLDGGLQDAFNKIGTSQEGLIAGGYKMTISLVENYETIGKILVGLVATYGTYRTAIVLNTVATNGLTFAENLHKISILACEKAQKLLNATMLKNPYVAVAYIIIGLVTAMWALSDSTTAAEKAQENYNKVKEESIAKEKEHKGRVEELISVLNNNALADLERVNALEELKNKYPEIFKKYDIESIKLADILKLKKEIAEMDNKNAVEGRKSAYEKALEDVRKAEENLAKAQQAPTMRFEQTERAKSRLEQAKANLVPFEADMQNDRINSFIAGIDKMTDAQIKAELEARKRLEGALNKSGNKQGHISDGLLSGTFDKSQINQQTNALEAEMTKRNQAKYSYIEIEKKYNEELKNLLVKRKQIESNQGKFTEEQIKNQLKELDSQIDNKQKEIKELTGKTPKQNASEGKQAESAAEKARKQAQKISEFSLKLQNLQADLDNESIKQQLDYEQKLLDIEQDSFDKRYRQNQLNTAKEFVAIEEYRQKMAKAQQDAAKDVYVGNNGTEKGFDFKTFDKSLLPDGLKDSDIEAQVKNMTDAVLAAYKKGTEDISKELQIFKNEENLTFASQLDQQIYSIRAHYAERRKLAKNNAELLRQINSNESKEIIAARLEVHQRQLESDLDYNQKYLQLVEDRYVFESDKQKASLEQQIKDQKKIFSDLEKQVLNDPENIELSNQLRNAYIQLRILNKELAKTPNQKFAEIVGYVNEVVGALSQLEGMEGIEKVSSFFTSAAQFATGDYIGGGMSALTGLIGLFASEEDKRLKIQRELNKLQQEYNISLRQQNVDLISSIDYTRAFRDNIQALQWLVEKGFISDVDYTAWDTLNGQFEKLQNNVDKAQSEMDGYMRRAAVSISRWGDGSMISSARRRQITDEWANSEKTVNDTIYALERLQATGIEGYEGLIESLKNGNSELTDITEQLTELSRQMDEFATGTSFDSFLSDAANAIKGLKGDISNLADFTEESLSNAVLSSFKYQILSGVLKEYYDQLANEFTNKGIDGVDKGWAENWKSSLAEELAEQSKYLNDLFDKLGIDTSLDTESSSKGIASISQDSANELNGNFFALLQKAGDTRNICEASRLLLFGINNGLIDINSVMKENSQVFRDSLKIQEKIEANTAKTVAILDKIQTLGITIRN